VKLRVLQARAEVSLLFAFVVPIAIAVLVSRVIPLDTGTVSAKVAWVVLAAVYFGCFALQQHYIPRLLRLRFVRDGEVVDYPLETLAKELEAEAQLVKEQQELESPDVGKAAWTCASCGEENPGNFEVCWKCQSARPSEVSSGNRPQPGGN
jgi:hypothetical protein